MGLYLSHWLTDRQYIFIAAVNAASPGRCKITAREDAHFSLSSTYLLLGGPIDPCCDTLRTCLRVLSRMGADEMKCIVSITHVAIMVYDGSLTCHVLHQQVLLGPRELTI